VLRGNVIAGSFGRGASPLGPPPMPPANTIWLKPNTAALKAT